MSDYTQKQLARFPHLSFWEEMYCSGWRTDIGYGPAKYQVKLPESSGVYLFGLIDMVFADFHRPVRIAYIGKSKSLYKRHQSHEVKALIEYDMNPDWAVDLWFKSIPPDQITEEEIRLIRRFNPPYNLQHRVRGL